MVEAQLALTVLMGLFLAGVAVWLSRIEDWRSYTPLAGGGGAVGEESGYAHEEKPGGLIRWLTTVDHKDIGLLYGTFATIAFVVGGLMVILMRTELIAPAEDIIGAQFYNSLLTSHGITMLFLFGTPVISAFGNYFIPLLIDADDMAFPRINAIAFWMLPPGALLIWAGFLVVPFTDIQPAQTAWTMYTPLSAGVGTGTQGGVSGLGIDFMLLGLHLTGISATMGAINFIATIFSERGSNVNWANLDIFSWTMLTQSGLILFAFPLLGSALIMLLFDRNLGTTFFLVEGGGPILWQHLFWFFGHPEVYILALPPMGILSFLIPKFSGRKLFGFKFVVYSTLAIGVLSFGVWAHHMFSTGIDPRIRASFMAVSLAIAIPSAVKTFNWITTMWGGNVRLTAPMLFCIGAVSNFIFGGVTGVFLAAIPVDLVLHDTYYIVGHFHYILMGLLGFSVFAAIYYWFPIFTGKMYQKRFAKWHFWLSMIGTNLTFFAMLLLGYLGMPRRYATYTFGVGPQEMITVLHQLATLGAFIILVGQIIWVWNMIQSWYEAPTLEDDDPWDLKETNQFTNEWGWNERRMETAIADGGERSGSSRTSDNERSESSGSDEDAARTDGGERADGARSSSDDERSEVRPEGEPRNSERRSRERSESDGGENGDDSPE